jgi:hypothetical protein
MSEADPRWVAATRRRDLLLTLVMVCIVLTPAWLLPNTVGLPWMIAVIVLAVPAVWASWRHAPWQPTPHAELERVLEALALTGGQRFCDLGAGDGRMVQWVHEATGADCEGLEISPLPWAFAQLRLLGAGPGAHVRLADLYRTDLSAFDVLYVWGTAYSVGTERFVAHLQRSARPGTRLVSYHTPVHGLEPFHVDTTGQRPLYVYTL